MIHGKGVFSNRTYEPDELVGCAISSLIDEAVSSDRARQAEDEGGSEEQGEETR